MEGFTGYYLEGRTGSGWCVWGRAGGAGARASERMAPGEPGACVEEGVKVPMGHVEFERLVRQRGRKDQEAAVNKSLEGFMESRSQDQEENQLG